MTGQEKNTDGKFRSTHPEFDVEGLLDFAEIDITAAMWDPFSSPRLDTYATYAGGDLNANDNLSNANEYRSVLHSAFNTWLKNSASSQDISLQRTNKLITVKRFTADEIVNAGYTETEIHRASMGNGENWSASQAVVTLHSAKEASDIGVELSEDELEKKHILVVKHLPYPVLSPDLHKIDAPTLVWPDDGRWSKPLAAPDLLTQDVWEAEALAAINAAYSFNNASPALDSIDVIREDLSNYVVRHEWAALPYFDLFFRVLEKMGHPLWGSLNSEIQKHGAGWSQDYFVKWLNHRLIVDGSDDVSKFVTDRDVNWREYRPFGTDKVIRTKWIEDAVNKLDEDATRSEKRDAERYAEEEFQEARRRWYIPQPAQQFNEDLPLKYRMPYYVTPVLTSYIHFLHLMWCAEDYAARQGKTMDEFDPSDPPARELAYRLSRAEMRDGIDGEKKRERDEIAEKREKAETTRRAASEELRSTRQEKKRENKRLHALKRYGAKSGQYLDRLRELGYTAEEIAVFRDDSTDTAGGAVETAAASGDTGTAASPVDVDYARDLHERSGGIISISPDGQELLIDGVNILDLEAILAANGVRITRRAHKLLNGIKYRGGKGVKMLLENVDARNGEDD